MDYEELLNLETFSHSKFSPCIISDDEKIARVIFSPKQYSDGEIHETAFTQIFSLNGMSVLRLNYSFQDSLIKTIKSLQKDDKNQYAGYVCANIEDIRKIIIDDFRVFYILDTAREDRVGHADIFSIRLPVEMGLSKKILTKYIRHKIAEVFNELTLVK
jgi:hypothetical protein